MKKKVFVLVLALFLVSGCDVTYNLNVSKDLYEEKTSIIENNTLNFYGSEPAKLAYNNFYRIPLPLFDYVVPPTPTNNSVVVPEEEDVDYYDKNNISSDNKIGMIYTGKFKPSTIEHSSIINYAATDYQYKETSEEISFSVGSLEKMFKQFPTLDKITINMNVNGYEALENNADKTSGKTYIWEITKDNYKDKNINIVISKLDTTQLLAKNVKNTVNSVQNIGIIIVCIFIVLMSFIVYFIVKSKQTKENKF